MSAAAPMRPHFSSGRKRAADRTRGACLPRRWGGTQVPDLARSLCTQYKTESIMGLLDMLQQYVDAAPGQPIGAASDHFQQVAQSAPPQVVGQGIAEALRSDQTPPFSQMVGQLF